MAGYAVFSDVSGYLLELVRDSVCPILLKNREQAALCAPDEEAGEAALGVYLYEIEDFSSYVPGRAVSAAGNTVGFPPLAVGLHYMVFFNQSAQVPLEERIRHSIFGRVMQAVHSRPSIDVGSIHAAAGPEDEPAALSFARLSSDEKRAVWMGISAPMRPALYLQAAPLLISGGGRELPRVRAVRGEVSPR